MVIQVAASHKYAATTPLAIETTGIPHTHAKELLDLITAVEINDLRMPDFISAYTTRLHKIPGESTQWHALSVLINSVAAMFKEQTDMRTIAHIEAENAELITIRFALMKKILAKAPL